MSIQLKFKIDVGVDNANIKPTRKNNGKGVLKLPVHGGYVIGLKSGNTDADVIQGNGELHRSDSPTYTKIRPNEITSFNFEADFKEIERLARLICLREKLKGANAVNTDNDITTVVVQDISATDDKLRLPIATATGKEVDFTDGSFTSGSFNTNKVKIGVFTNGGAGTAVAKDFGNAATDLHQNLTTYVTAWKKLEDLLDALATDYAVGDAKNLKDADGAAADTIEKDIAKLTAYQTAGAAGDSPEKTLWEMDHVSIVKEDGNAGDGGTWYQNQIKSWITYLQEFRVWKKMGVNKITDILRANANGFIISKRGLTGTDTTIVTIGEADADGNLTSNAKDTNNLTLGVATDPGSINIAYLTDASKPFTIANGKYRGYQVFESTQKIDDLDKVKVAKGIGNGNISKVNQNYNLGFFGKGADCGKVSKTMIDAFLGKKFFGHLGEKTYDSTKTLQKRRGLKITDMHLTKDEFITEHGTMTLEDASKFGVYDESTDKASTTKDQLPTYLCGIVQSAPSIQAAIDLAFFGQAYFEDDSKFLDTDRWEGTKKDKITYKLFLNEVESMSKLDHLKLYFGWLLERGDIGANAYRKTVGNEDFGGADWSVDNLSNSSDSTATGPKAKAKAAYDAVKKILTMYDNEIYKTHKNDGTDPSKPKLEAEKKKWTDELAKKPTDFAAAGNDNEKKAILALESLINSRISEIQTLITNFDTTTNMPDDAKKVLTDAKEAEEKDSEAEKFYASFLTKYAPDAEVDKTVAENVVKIVKAVKDVLGTSPNETQCNALKTLASGKAWDKAKDVDVDTKKWVVEALTKANAKLSELLQAAKDAAKAAMKGEGDSYAKIGIDDETSAETINKITELFNKVKAAWNEKAYNDGIEQKKSELKNFKDNEEWKKIDKYEKGGKKYATGALENLESLKKKNESTIENLKKLATGNEVMTEYKKADNTAGVDKETAQRVAIYVEFKNSSVKEEKRLSELCEPTNDYSYSDENDKLDKSLEDIVKAIEELKAYKDASENDPKGKALKKITEKISEISDAKPALDKWIQKLEARKQHLETKKQERDKEKESPKTKESFYKHPVFIIGACVLVTAIVGGIAWLAFKGGSEEEEGEE